MKKYNHKQVEKKWQKYWESKKIFVTKDGDKKPKKYILDMFPYPSGAGLHVGHPEGYTATDIYSRYLRMKGFNVLHPMGWDAFGLPAENYAIKMGVHPQKTTDKNIKRFTEQIKSIGLSYDWSRQVNTSSPDYYKWTQWLFLQLYKKGLAYKKEAYVNWCPKDNTVLANEQVIDGKCDRCGTQVVQKNLSQWFFKITDYSDRLLEGLEKVDWPEPIKIMQKNWIGKSIGAEIDFSISNPAIKRFVLLHGRGSSPDKAFLPWLKTKLESQGYEVVVPALPGAEEPNDLEQANFVIKNCKLDESTVIVGHSFGGLVALRILEQGIKVHKVIFAATPYLGRFSDGKARKSVVEAIKRGFNFDKIKSQANTFISLSDEQDHIVPLGDGELLAKDLNGLWSKKDSNKPHFNGTEEPFIYEYCINSVKVFTTRPDTIFGATYVVVAPEHPILKNLEYRIENREEVQKYVEAANAKKELERMAEGKDKTGVELKGVTAINPATGKEITVWVADYVLGHYGTGAVMAVPAHDQRDFEFAKKYNLPIKQVIAQETGTPHPQEERRDGGCGIIFDPKTQKYAVAQSADGLIRLFAGGVEEGEDLQEGVLRELREESGLYDFGLVEKIKTCFAHFYNARRNTHRSALANCFLVILKSNKQQEPQLQEHEKDLNVAWMSAKEILENWKEKNKGGALDHWISFLQNAVGRAIELNVDTTSDKNLFKYEAFVDEGILIDSGEFSEIKSSEALPKMAAKFGKLTTQFKMRDWLVSRQRYWGAPIPIVYCEKCGMQPVPEKDLPVKLPTDVDFRPTGESPLKRSKSFSKVRCPKCKGNAQRDYDTMDTFVDSSWYYLRYADPKNKKVFADPGKIKKWLPVDTYQGGAEHAVLHLLYARFITKALKDLKFIKFEEPFLKLRNQGLILGPDGEKMSKSRGNVINPDDVIAEFGADSLRMYEMFMGPLEDAKPWSTNGMVGIKRFLDRVWYWVNARVGADSIRPKGKTKDTEKVEKALHKLVKKVTEDIENFRFNTSISSFMEFHNQIKDEPISLASIKTFLTLLYPFAPHIVEELHNVTGGKKTMQLEVWPKYNPKKIVDDVVQVIVQVNGKVKGKVDASPTASEQEVKDLALAVDAVKGILGLNIVKRVIYVPGRIINLVI